MILVTAANGRTGPGVVRAARQLAAVISAVLGCPVTAGQAPVAAALRAGVSPTHHAASPSEEADYRQDAMVRLFDHHGRYGITRQPQRPAVAPRAPADKFPGIRAA
jgi:aspartate/methionine/tyrosine aminotransferase